MANSITKVVYDAGDGRGSETTIRTDHGRAYVRATDHATGEEYWAPGPPPKELREQIRGIGNHIAGLVPKARKKAPPKK